MDRADIEGDAIALYHLAGLHASSPPGIGRLVRILLGTTIERISQFPRGRLAELCRVHGEWRIYVRRNVPVERLRFDAGHELAHWWFKRCGDEGEDIETKCDALAAALLAPRPFYLDVRRIVHDVVQIAAALGTTQSLAALREGEVTGRPVALVQTNAIRVRGNDWGWPQEPELRRIARVGHPALRRVPIRDEGKRVALLAA